MTTGSFYQENAMIGKEVCRKVDISGCAQEKA